MTAPLIAEVWCAAPHGAQGRPHRYRLANVYRNADGSWRVEFTGTDGAHVPSRPSPPGYVAVTCPRHGDALLSTSEFGVKHRDRSKPARIEIHRQ